MEISKFEKVIGVSFEDPALLEQAFIHRSYINENKKGKLGHNERLEFLGDAVLELIITDFLYKKYPDKTEGDLTAYRAALVNANTLAELALELGVNNYLLLSHGESKDTGRARHYILANTFEAVVGAIYLDQGYKAADKFVNKFVCPLITAVIANKAWIDSKSLFQEQAQEKAGVTPSYKVIKEMGPDHDKYFTVAVYLRNEQIAVGEGKSKQEAEQNAAEQGLKAKGWN